MSLNPKESLPMQRRKRKFHVVTVQGIGEGSKARDTGKKVTWLNDFLLKHYGAGQTTTFPNTLDIRAGILSTGIREAAVQLLEKVKKEMKQNKVNTYGIPSGYPAPSLLLIGYDLGGLIVKQALLIAINNEEYSFVAEKASLLVFIDTPHRVTEFESWESISLKLMLRKRPGGGYKFSKVLERSAQTLMEVSNSFQTVARIYCILSFYGDVKNTSSQPSLAFSRDTSTMGMSEEAYEPMYSDPVVREDLKEDEERGRFVDFLAKIVWRTKAIEELYLSCIRTLSMVDSEHRLGGVQPFASNPDVFNWILDREAYKNWIGPSCRLLWLHGRAESDVTAALCLLEKKACETFPDANVIKFSFDFRDDRYRSTYRMLACLSHQLLILQPALFDHVKLLYEKISHEMPWRIDRLWAFFRSLLACPHNDHGVTLCFVNMVDERDYSRSQFFYDLLLLPDSETSTGNFRLAVTSHKAPEFDSKFTVDAINIDPGRDEDPEERRKELEKVITREVHSLFRVRPELAKFGPIIKEKLRASEDGFTTSLTVALLQARQPQSTYRELETELSSLPHTTFGLYQHFLDKTPTERRLWSRKVLSWIIHASRPLKLTELAIALALQADVSSISTLQDRLPQDLALDLQQVFGNLIKIEHDKVFFVQSCFRDFLLQDRPRHQKSSWTYFDGHAALAESCLHYLSLLAAKEGQSKSEDDRDDADRLPKGVGYEFLEYAVQYWPKHYNSAEHDVYSALHKRACAFLQDPRSIQLWSRLRWAIGNPLERPQMSFKNPLPLMVRLRCGNIVRTLLEKADLDREDLPTALEVAIENGDETIIGYLRAAGAKSPMELHRAALYGRDMVMSQILKERPETDTVLRGSTPLHLASTAGYHTLVGRLLAANFNPNAKDEQELAPLHLASQFGHISVIEELLVRKISASINVTTDVNLEPDALTKTGSEMDFSTDVNPYSSAEFAADTTTVVDVKTDANVVANADANADINILDDSRLTPLHMATRWQQPDAVVKLLRLGANIDATDGFASTALHLAAKSGREDIVGILLSHYEALQENPGASETLQNALKSQDSRSFTPLHLAAGEGHTGVVRQLLGKPEASNSASATMIVDSSGNTPLHLAAENGHAGVVEALMEPDMKRWFWLSRARRHPHKSHILTTNKQSQAPIHLAVLSGDASVVTKLCAEHRRQRASLDLFDFDKQSPLHLASRDGLADVVGILLKYGARADIADENAETPLLLGCAFGHLEIVKELLKKGANLMSANSQGRSALHQATAVGALGVAQELLRASRKLLNNRDYVNLRDNDGSTALHLAAEAGNVQVMELLLNEKADVKAVNGNGDSVLYLASERGHIEMVEFLIRKIKEDIEGADEESSPSGWGLLEAVRALLLKTPDDRAETDEIDNTDVTESEGHSREILTALLGVPGRWDSAQYQSILRLAAQKGITGVVDQILDVEGVDLNNVDDEEKTALLLAAQNGRSLVVKKLLEVLDIDRDRQDNNGRSAISYAAELGHLEIVESLASGRRSAMKFETYVDALGYAAAAGHINVVTFFLDNVTVAQPGDTKRSPLNHSLERAISGGHDQIVSLLMARDADVNTLDGSASTPLHLAARLGNTKICEMLLKSRKISDINAKDSRGRTTLFLAVSYEKYKVIGLLLQFHADTEAPDEDGWRPLHAAYDSIAITQILLEAGAKVDSITQNEETPLFVAIHRGYEGVSKELLRHGANPLAATDTGRTPLHEAAVASDDFFRLVLEHTDKLRKSADPMDDKKRSPLSIAAARGRVGVVKALVDREDIEINQKDDEGYTPLRCAVMEGHDEVVALLLESPKLNLSGSSEAPEDLLRDAAQQESQKTLTLLLDKDIHVYCGIDVLFEIAMETENARLIELALENCHDGSKQDRHGWSLEWMKCVNSPSGNERANLPETSGTEFLPPTRWNEADKTGLLRVEGDGLTVFHELNLTESLRGLRDFYTYSRVSSRRLLHRQTGVVRADHPIPPFGEFKFEIEILDEGQTGIIGTGFGHKDAPLENRMPGWDLPSWGYHGDDGKKFHGSGTGTNYAEKYGKGDVIGCHIDQSKGTASFTKNGKDLGIAFEGIRGRLFPMVGVRSPEARVAARFSWNGINGNKGQESLALELPDNGDEVESILPEDEYSDLGSSP